MRTAPAGSGGNTQQLAEDYFFLLKSVAERRHLREKYSTSSEEAKSELDKARASAARVGLKLPPPA